jgi:hypothetical protein
LNRSSSLTLLAVLALACASCERCGRTPPSESIGAATSAPPDGGTSRCVYDAECLMVVDHLVEGACSCAPIPCPRVVHRSQVDPASVCTAIAGEPPPKGCEARPGKCECKPPTPVGCAQQAKCHEGQCAAVELM